MTSPAENGDVDNKLKLKLWNMHVPASLPAVQTTKLRFPPLGDVAQKCITWARRKTQEALGVARI